MRNGQKHGDTTNKIKITSTCSALANRSFRWNIKKRAKLKKKASITRKIEKKNHQAATQKAAKAYTDREERERDLCLSFK